MIELFTCLILLLLVVNISFAQTEKIEILEFEREVLIEKGWMKYLSVVVKNSGDEILHNVSVSITDGHPDWFEVQTNKTDIDPNETANFLIKTYISFDTNIGSYSFTLLVEADEATKNESLKINVFTSRVEMTLYQIQGLRDDIKELEDEAEEVEKTGKNVTGVIVLLNEAKSFLGIAENYINNNMINDAVEKIIDAGDLLKEAEYEITIVPPIKISAFPLEWILIIILIIIIIAAGVFFRKKIPRRITIRKEFQKGPALAIKKLILQGGEAEKIMGEIRNLREWQSLIEEEYKQNLISKESYEELRAKYEKRILDLENELRKG